VNPLSIGWQRSSLGGGSVEVQWLGTAGFAIRAEGATLLLDPYVTRASLWSCVAGALAPDHALAARLVPRADAIVLGHTHFDHALDAPSIARRTGAHVFGSRSAVALCRASGIVEAQTTDVESRTQVGSYEAEVGPFRLRFHPSAHSKLLAGRVPFPGEISDCDEIPMRADHYKCGAVFGVEIHVAGKTIVHVGSAELVEEKLVGRRGDVDLALVCVAGWTSSVRFPERVVRALSPEAILLSHWDDFFRPIAEPARALPAMRTGALVERLAKASRDVRIGTLPLLGDVLL
jgi:L-ascorbate metabolism protein UlaG (beta-lactamase superfamily)